MTPEERRDRALKAVAGKKAKRAKTPIEKLHAKAKREALEQKFIQAWRALGGLIDPENTTPMYSPPKSLFREYTPKLVDLDGNTRGWRFDFANPHRKIAIEIEGGVWTGGRHTRGAGFIDDCEKYNAATLADWRVLRLTGEMIDTAHLRAIMEAM